MRISESEFFGTLGKGSIYDHHSKSILPLRPGDKPRDRRIFLESLYRDLRSGSYFPSIPRGYIVYDKHRRVARIVPVFAYRDSCVFYLCVRQIEDAIAGNRVQGTYGGWRLGNVIRAREEAEWEESANEAVYEAEVTVESDEYSIPGSFDPRKWLKLYKDFQRIAKDWSMRGDIGYFIEFDIANFYDTIDLDILERKLRLTVPREKNDVLDLLFVFLRNWNRGFQGYGPKSVGVPQDDIGDCSRMLANFYLQDYDQFMLSECHNTKTPGRYLRYADDQIIMTSDWFDATRILFESSKELHRIGLNINSGKVNEFASRVDFDHYWAFSLFDLLADPDDVRAINQAALTFVEQMNAIGGTIENRPWRSSSVLKRLVSVGLNKIRPELRKKVLNTIMLSVDFARWDAWVFERLFQALEVKERQDLIEAIETRIPEVHYNSFHLNILKFYRRCGITEDLGHIERRIEELAFE